VDCFPLLSLALIGPLRTSFVGGMSCFFGSLNNPSRQAVGPRTDHFPQIRMPTGLRIVVFSAEVAREPHDPRSFRKLVGLLDPNHGARLYIPVSARLYILARHVERLFAACLHDGKTSLTSIVLALIYDSYREKLHNLG
jgi:hypothetical protein